MTVIEPDRSLSWDWYPGHIPDNVVIADGAYIETSFSFYLYRSEQPEGVRIGRGSSTYLGTMFDVSSRGQVRIGDFSLVHGAWFVCDAAIEVGDYALISWNVVFMDTYRLPRDPITRRKILEEVPLRPIRRLPPTSDARPIRIGSNVWIGFDCCVLPGVTIGDGAIVGARSVVVADVPPYTVVAGNPARVIRRLVEQEKPE